MQSQYVYLSDITQPLIALYFSVELSTLYKSAGFSFEYCLQFWTCIYSTNRVIVYFNLLWSVVYMLLNSTVSIWTKIRPSLVAATRIHLEALPPGMQELSGSCTTQQHGSHQCEAPGGQELKVGDSGWLSQQKNKELYHMDLWNGWIPSHLSQLRRTQAL